MEDDPAARRPLTLILGRNGFAVSEAATLADALAALAPPSPPPHWLLLDLMLPDGSGLDALRHVRARSLATRVCVITASGPDLVRAARASGADHVLTKPLCLPTLLHTLSR